RSTAAGGTSSLPGNDSLRTCGRRSRRKVGTLPEPQLPPQSRAALLLSVDIADTLRLAGLARPAIVAAEVRSLGKYGLTRLLASTRFESGTVLPTSPSAPHLPGTGCCTRFSVPCSAGVRSLSRVVATRGGGAELSPVVADRAVPANFIVSGPVGRRTEDAA